MTSAIELAYRIAEQSSHPTCKVGCCFESKSTGTIIVTHNVELGTKCHDIAPTGQCLEYIHAEVWASQMLMQLPFKDRTGHIAMTYEPCAPCARALLLAGFRGSLEYDRPWLDPALKTNDWGKHKQGITVLRNNGIEVTRSLEKDGARWVKDLNFGDWYPQCMNVLKWGEIRYRDLNKKACMLILNTFNRYLGLGFSASKEVIYGVTNYTLTKNFNKSIKDFVNVASKGSSWAKEPAYTIVKCASEAYRRVV